MCALYKDFYQVQNTYDLTSDKIIQMNVIKLGDAEYKVAFGTSSEINTKPVIYRIDSAFSKLGEIRPLIRNLCDIRFCPCDSRNVFAGCRHGEIHLCDARSGYRSVSVFKYDKKGIAKPINTFDVSPDGKQICAGTELIDGCPYLLFWDIRSKELMGAYWQSHTDDISKVYFSTLKRNELISASADGLLNTFDLTVNTETEALIESQYTMSSIEKLFLLEESGIDRQCGVVTHNGDIQLWSVMAEAPCASFSPNALAAGLQFKCKPEDIYVAGIFRKQDGLPLIIAGSSVDNGDSLRIMGIHNGNLLPVSDLPANKKMVNATYYDPQKDLIFMAGESSQLTLWTFSTPKSKEISMDESQKLTTSDLQSFDV